LKRTVALENRTRGEVLGTGIGVADNYWTRLRGLLGRKGLAPGEGLLIVPSRGVHMFGMRFPLDVLLLDEGRTVRKVYQNLEPGQNTGMHRGIRYALELPVGVIEATQTQEGDELSWTTS
jgi:uncharacterized protein